MKTVTVVLMTLMMTICGSSLVWSETPKNFDEEYLREFIKKVIRENPDLIYETVNNYVLQQRAEKDKDKMEATFKERILDTVNAENPVKGPDDAPITIIEYSDYQCPYCGRASETIDGLMKKFPNQIRVTFKNSPQRNHNQALPAAYAALAAHKQGKFWDYHNLLFLNSQQLNEELLIKLAQDLSLDLDRFNKDRNSPEIIKQVADEQEKFKSLGFSGVPMFIINGVVVRGAQAPPFFEEVVRRLIEEKKNTKP